MTTIVNEQELTNEEWQNQINDALNAFDIDAHFDALNEEHSKHFKAVIKSLMYVDIYDVVMCATGENEYQEEAQTLQQYYYLTWSEIEQYIANEPTAETQKTLLEIITSYEDFITD